MLWLVHCICTYYMPAEEMPFNCNHISRSVFEQLAEADWRDGSVPHLDKYNHLISKLPLTGIYVVMFQDVFYTFIQIVLLSLCY